MTLNIKEVQDCLSSLPRLQSEQLTLRLQSLLYDLSLFDGYEADEISLLELLVRLVLLADAEPAELIANLMVPLSTESSYSLDKNTLPDSAAFLRDYLKKDQVLAALAESREGSLGFSSSC